MEESNTKKETSCFSVGRILLPWIIQAGFGNGMVGNCRICRVRASKAICITQPAAIHLVS